MKKNGIKITPYRDENSTLKLFSNKNTLKSINKRTQRLRFINQKFVKIHGIMVT